MSKIITKKAAGRQKVLIEPESLSEELSTKSTCAQRPMTSFDIPFLITFDSPVALTMDLQSLHRGSCQTLYRLREQGVLRPATPLAEFEMDRLQFKFLFSRARYRITRRRRGHRPCPDSLSVYWDLSNARQHENLSG